MNRPIRKRGADPRKRAAYVSHIKSGVLAVLVITSVLLSGLIAQGTGGAAGGYDPLKLPSKQVEPGLKSLFYPRMLVLHQGSNEHYGFLAGTDAFGKLWGENQMISRFLSSVSGLRKEPPAPAEIRRARAEGSLEMVFGDGYSPFELAQVYGGSPSENLPSIDRLIFSYDDRPVVYARTHPEGAYVAFALREPVAPDRETLSSVTMNEASRYYELPTEVAGMRVAGGTFVPMNPRPMAALAVQRDPSGASVVLSTFFLDVSLLRRIEELDGALIYSDGRRGVRIYPSGAMDYGQPAPGGSSIEKMGAIRKAALFSLEHGGLPGTAYIDRLGSVDDLESESTRIRFNFRYAGQPVLGTRGVIEVLVSSAGAEEFLRNFRAPVGRSGDEMAVVSLETGLRALKNAETRLFGNADPGIVVAVELGYLNGAPEDYIEPLRPIWHVEFDTGFSVAVDAHDTTVTLVRRGMP